MANEIRLPPEATHLEIYPTPIPGAGIAIFSTLSKEPRRRDLELLLNLNTFQMGAQNAHLNYDPFIENPSIPVAYIPEKLKTTLDKIEMGIDAPLDSNYVVLPSSDNREGKFRRKLNLKYRIDGADATLDDFQALVKKYPLLMIAREAKEMDTDKSNKSLKHQNIPEFKIYVVNPGDVYDAYENGTFKKTDETNGPEAIVQRGSAAIIRTVSAYAMRLLGIANLKASGDHSKEILEQLQKTQTDYATVLAKLQEVQGVNKALTSQYDQTVKENNEYFQRWQESQKIAEDAIAFKRELELAQEQMNTMFDPLGGKKSKTIKGEDGSEIVISYIGSSNHP